MALWMLNQKRNFQFDPLEMDELKIIQARQLLKRKGKRGGKSSGVKNIMCMLI